MLIIVFPFRPEQYANARLILLCFSLVKRESMKNVEFKWYPEVQEHCMMPVILVGLQSDLRNSNEISNDQKVSYNEGADLANAISAISYIECSAKSSEGITELFQIAAQILTIPPTTSEPKKSEDPENVCFSCQLL
jgi:GTPase SAR1 family protein